MTLQAPAHTDKYKLLKDIIPVLREGESKHGTGGVIVYNMTTTDIVYSLITEFSSDFCDKLSDMLSDEPDSVFVIFEDNETRHIWRLPRVDILNYVIGNT